MLRKSSLAFFNLKTIKKMVLIAGVVIAFIAFLVTNTTLF